MGGLTQGVSGNQGEDVVLLLGSNMGDRERSLEEACSRIEKAIGRIQKSSSIYGSRAWGNREQADFLNKSICLQTKLNPEELLDPSLGTERSTGSQRTMPMGTRTIDIDTFIIGGSVISSETLTVPHPLMQLRKFVLLPVSEIAGDFTHPVLGKSVSDLLSACSDDLPVWKYRS